MLFFKQKPPSPFTELRSRLEGINTELYKYLYNKKFEPTAENLREIDLLYNRYHEGFSFCGYFYKKMEVRGKDEAPGG